MLRMLSGCVHRLCASACSEGESESEYCMWSPFCRALRIAAKSLKRMYYMHSEMLAGVGNKKLLRSSWVEWRSDALFVVVKKDERWTQFK